MSHLPMPAPETQSLATRAIRGVFWTGGAIGIQMGVTALFFMFLPVQTMGQFAAALAVILFFPLVCDLGLGAALVQCREADERHFSSAFWTSLGFGLCTTGLLILVAPLIARFSDEPLAFQDTFVRLTALLPVAAVSGVLRARLQRDLRFGAIAVVEAGAVVAAALVGIGALLSGLGAWCLVLHTLTREAAHLAGLWSATRWLPRLHLHIPSVRRLLSFGLNAMGANAVNYLNRRLDYAFLYYFLGDAALGYYDFANRLTMHPYTRLATTVGRVSFPTFSYVQEDSALLRRGYLKSVSSIALLAWPLLAGLVVFAADVLAWIGPDMTPALRAFQFLALASLLKAIGTLVGSVWMAKGKAVWALRWTLFSLALTLPGYYLGVRFGPEGMAAAILLLSALFLPLSQHLVNRLIGLAFPTYLRALGRPLLVTLWVLAVLWAVRSGLSTDPFTTLLVGLACGLVAYSLGLRLWAWDLCRQLWQSLRGSDG